MDLIFNVFKESNYSSFDIVRTLRKKFSIKRIGYIGTLDPFATGVLPIFAGNYTKLIPYITNEMKVYKFFIEFGVLTDTLDITGNIIEKKEIPSFTKEGIYTIIKENFMQNYLQIPPKFSAKKINGRRAYKMARNNEYIELNANNVQLKDFEILEVYDNGFSGIIETSKGFYVRAFARDIAEKLKTVGIVKELQRIQNGDFNIKESKNIKELCIQDSIDVLSLMKNYMKIKYENEENMKKLKFGQIIENNELENGMYLFVTDKHRDLIICEIKNALIKVKRVIK